MKLKYFIFWDASQHLAFLEIHHFLKTKSQSDLQLDSVKTKIPTVHHARANVICNNFKPIKCKKASLKMYADFLKCVKKFQLFSRNI